jgi:uncharacterized phage-associated protein
MATVETRADSSQRTARIVTRFDERKTTAAAAYLLDKASGKMPYIKLIKLLYLADRESWRRYDRPITGDRYVSMNFGPVLSATYDLLRSEDATAGGRPWSRTIITTGYEAKLQAPPDLGPLSDAEIEILDEVFQLTERMDRWRLCDLTHAFPEWRDPEGSSIPIQPEEILKALGKSEEQIDLARQEAAERRRFEEIFGA